MEDSFVLILQAVGAALITTLATIYISRKKIAASLATAEMADRAAFRKDLMDSIFALHKELEECQKQHEQANLRIMRLEDVLRRNGIEVIDV